MRPSEAKPALTRSEYKHRAIQQAGTEIFLELGYEAATMDHIAAKAGVSKQTVYNHFQSKDGLFKATIADLTSALMAPLVVRDLPSSPPERLLRSLARSEEHTSELQSLMRISYAVFSLKKKNPHNTPTSLSTANNKQ